MQVVLADLDVWHQALTRHDPDPLVVHRLASLVQQRQVQLVGAVRQALLARARDERQAERLGRILAPFPDLRAGPDTHVRAAAHQRRARQAGLRLLPRQALLWALAEEVDGLVWSHDPGWGPAVALGCPLTRSGGA